MIKLTSAVGAVFGLCLTLVPVTAHEGMQHDGCPIGQTFTAGDLTVSGAFTRATLPKAPVGAGFFTIENTGSSDDRLVSVSSEISPTIELHTMRMVDDVMKMEELTDGIAIPAGETVSLAPGGLHVMIIGPNQPFVEGECVSLTLEFEAAGTLPIVLNVGPLGAREAPMAHDGADHDMRDDADMSDGHEMSEGHEAN